MYTLSLSLSVSLCNHCIVLVGVVGACVEDKGGEREREREEEGGRTY